MRNACIMLAAALFICCGNPTIERGYGETPEDLGRAVVFALNAESEADLHRLRVDKDQYINDLWPEFSSPGFTGEFAWGNLNKKCLRGAPKWVKRYGGKNYEFVRIRFSKPTQSYEGFKLRQGAVLTVRTPKGEERDLNILGSVVERDRYYRLLSYDD